MSVLTDDVELRDYCDHLIRRCHGDPHTAAIEFFNLRGMADSDAMTIDGNTRSPRCTPSFARLRSDIAGRSEPAWAPMVGRNAVRSRPRDILHLAFRFTHSNRCLISFSSSASLDLSRGGFGKFAPSRQFGKRPSNNAVAALFM